MMQVSALINYLVVVLILAAIAAAVIAAVAAAVIARRRHLQSRGSVFGSRPFEDPRLQWDSIITKALHTHHSVTLGQLEPIPPHVRVMAMQRYVDSHKELDLLFRPDPPAITPAKGTLLQRFVNNWSALLARVDAPDVASPIAARLVEQLCQVLGFTPLERRMYRTFPGYMVQAPTVRLSIPQRFPIVFLLKPSLSAQDLREIRDLMHVFSTTSFFAILVVATEPDWPASKLEALRLGMPSGAEDFIVAGYQDLVNLFLASDPVRSLMELVLAQIDLTMVSPYVTWGPVSEFMFFGRDYELKAIMRTIQDRSYSIVGGRKIGKTSVLTKVKRLMEQTSSCSAVYLDCQHVTNYAEFFEALEIVSGVEIGSTTPDVMRRVAVRLRQQRPKQDVVLLLDEVDQLLRYDQTNQTRLFKVFRALSQEGLCRFVLCGERALHQALHDPGSPLFNFCNIMPLTHLLPDDAERIILEPMATLGVEFENANALVKEIIELSSCHPNIVQAICQMLVVRINERGDRIVRMDDLMHVRRSNEFLDFFFEVIWGNATTLERLITVVQAGQTSFSTADVAASLAAHGCEVSLQDTEQALRMLALFSVMHKRDQMWSYTAASLPRVMLEAKLEESFREGLVDAFVAERLEEKDVPR